MTFSMPMLPIIGSKAPSFSLPDQDGAVHTLRQYAGSWVLLYFYPKDDTPGCTMEACGLRDAWAGFRKIGAHVLGVSVDPVKAHAKFAVKYALPFPLLSDADKTVVAAYGVWAKKKFMGREYLGTLRHSFLIDPKGKIAKIYLNVSPKGHAEEVLADLATLSNGAKKGGARSGAAGLTTRAAKKK